MKKLTVFLFVSFATMLSGNAANWVATGSTPAKGIYNYTDTESISMQGNYKQAFTKTINIPTEVFFVALHTYDCKSNPRRTKLTYITKFDLEGTVIFSSAITRPFEPVFPESVEEKEVGFVCDF